MREEQPDDLDDQLTGCSAFCDQVTEEREAYEQGLRVAWEHEDDFDQLPGEIAATRYATLAAEAPMRLLIGYDREFTRPRPYRLEDLARAGMAISGVRTAYDDDVVAGVARLRVRPSVASG